MRCLSDDNGQSFTMSTTPRFEVDKPCSECGQFGAYDFSGELLCLDCYQQRGSCCAERELAEREGLETNTLPSREDGRLA